MNFIEAVNYKNDYPEDKVYCMLYDEKVYMNIVGLDHVTYLYSGEYPDYTFVEDVNAEWFIEE